LGLLILILLSLGATGLAPSDDGQSAQVTKRLSSVGLSHEFCNKGR